MVTLHASIPTSNAAIQKRGNAVTQRISPAPIITTIKLTRETEMTACPGPASQGHAWVFLTSTVSMGNVGYRTAISSAAENGELAAMPKVNAVMEPTSVLSICASLEAVKFLFKSLGLLPEAIPVVQRLTPAKSAQTAHAVAQTSTSAKGRLMETAVAPQGTAEQRQRTVCILQH
jgi:hypothetical protein